MSSIYKRPPTPDEIYHHGILGQKWGKRNGPPYPLGVGDHSAAERKAGWRKSLKDTSGNTHYESLMTKRANNRADNAKKEAQSDKEKEKELRTVAKEYQNAAKKEISQRKIKRLNKMAESANSDADSYKESANEWKEIGDYQSKRAKASSEFDARMQREAIKQRQAFNRGKNIVRKTVYDLLSDEKMMSMAKAAGMDQHQAYTYSILGDIGDWTVLYARRQWINDKTEGRKTFDKSKN